MLSGRLFCQIIAQILWDGCEFVILLDYMMAGYADPVPIYVEKRNGPVIWNFLTFQPYCNNANIFSFCSESIKG